MDHRFVVSKGTCDQTIRSELHVVVILKVMLLSSQTMLFRFE